MVVKKSLEWTNRRGLLLPTRMSIQGIKKYGIEYYQGTIFLSSYSKNLGGELVSKVQFLGQRITDIEAYINILILFFIFVIKLMVAHDFIYSLYKIRSPLFNSMIFDPLL